MFQQNRCDFCGECLARCYYLAISEDIAGQEFQKLVQGEEVSWLHDCITCFACNEYCSKDARPFDLILKRMEEDGTYFDLHLLKQVAERFAFHGEPRPVEVKNKAMSVCVMGGIIPWALQGQLFESIPLLQGRPYFCNVLFMHLGNEFIMKERLQKTVNNLAQSGAREIVFFHEDCYALFQDLAPQYGVEVPFQVVHLFEYLRDNLLQKREKIAELEMKVAYQRPCASRYTPPEVEAVLDEVFDLIGIERVNRRYDGQDALCCGADAGIPGLELKARGEKLQPVQEKNIEDAVQNGAEALAYLCPMCFHALHQKGFEAGLKSYMVSDLCRLALGETLPEEKQF